MVVEYGNDRSQQFNIKCKNLNEADEIQLRHDGVMTSASRLCSSKLLLLEYLLFLFTLGRTDNLEGRTEIITQFYPMFNLR